jgi:hypothetical protein
MDTRFWSILGLLGVVFLLGVLHAKYHVFGSATDQPQIDLSKGLIGYWSFDDTDISGHIVYDSSGKGRNGTLTNGLHTVVGKIGQAMEFHGGADYVDIASDFIPRKAVTISVWVYGRSNGGLGNGRIFDNGALVLKVPNAERLTFSSDGRGTEASSGYGSFNLNVWTHVVVMRTSTGVTNFYIDGVLSGTANQNSGTPAAGRGHVSIGNAIPSDRTDVGWDGLIDDMRIYDRALSAEEIKRLHDMGR